MDRNSISHYHLACNLCVVHLCASVSCARLSEAAGPMLWIHAVVSCCYDAGDAVSALVVARNRFARLGNGVVGDFGGVRIVELSPSSVSFVTLNSAHQTPSTPTFVGPPDYYADTHSKLH